MNIKRLMQRKHIGKCDIYWSTHAFLVFRALFQNLSMYDTIIYTVQIVRSNKSPEYKIYSRDLAIFDQFSFNRSSISTTCSYLEFNHLD